LVARKDAKDKGNLPVPLHLRNAVTSLMKDLEYGKGYRYAHDDPKGAKDQTHLPKELEGRRYYRHTNFSPSTDDEEDLNAPW
jgi:putative ATPase